ncbi:MAG: aminotransferase class V-fold PLP-dependent enzyme [Planctomycetota bacterium]|nr:aminotransferase class V-fold PLP-dependent enzyme [Planctomycetota bacterium]
MATTNHFPSYADLCEQARSRIRIIEPESFALAPSTLLIDVRDHDEASAGVIEGAVVVPRGQLEKLIGQMNIPLEKDIVVYCETGNRSALACETLGLMGYENVSSLDGGVDGWQRLGRRLVPGQVIGPPGPDAAPGIRSDDAVDFADWASIRADFPITTTRIDCTDGVQRGLVYLDHAATTHPPTTALNSYSQFLGREYSNVHRATHSLARSATGRFEAAYGTCARFVGGNLDDGCVVFTSNTTHACDLVSHVLAQHPGKVLVTDLEHHSNDLPHRNRGEVVRIGLTPDLRLDLGAMEAVLKRERIKLVAVSGAANVTGWMPPIHEIARLAHEHGALICVDGAQLMAHHAIDVRPHGHPEHIDFLTAAGHKMYAPFGIGFLYGPRDLLDAAPPYLPGGGTTSVVGTDSVQWLPSPDRHQGGTPNIAGVIGMATVLEYLDAIGMDRVRAHEFALMQRAWEGLRKIDGITLYGPPSLDERVGILTFNVEGVSDLLCAAVLGAEAGIAVRNGRFCAHVHADLLLDQQGGVTQEPEIRPGAVRVSFGLYNNESEVDRFIEAIRMVRNHEWSGRYEVRGNQVDSTSAGRCSDAWMETAAD